ncbi:MAG: rod-binding protein [Nitrospirae bacterium]|nr:rod-binding protein [Nitrospirota bacterium]MBF0533534.1 rod-binding protein [Nitrospirota bacterium]MBF0615942.1 rod-binding protein [Nitrospirota bacterium]
MPVGGVDSFGALQQLKGKKDGKSVKTVACEMEALFIEQMLKSMRQTVKPMFGKGLGGDVFMGMFDTELSREFAKRGLGLQDMIVKQLNMKNEIQGKNTETDEDV